MNRFAAALCFAVTASAHVASQTQADFSLPEPALSLRSKVALWATHYFVHSVAEVTVGIPLRDKSGNAITGNIPQRDWCLGAIEGTVLVKLPGGSKTFNYAGAGGEAQVDCAGVLGIDPAQKPWITAVGKTSFAKAVGPYGDGVQGNVLVPYRTVAVDRAKIPFGTVLYIPRARGAEIPVAEGLKIQHDGYFFAGDTGGAIKGRHIDVFCGASSTNCFPGFIKSDESQTFDAFLIEDAAVKAKLRAIHKP
ncbi:MAG TPA: 3D domain-containing protein [Vicinamibacterales bacterium]|nr:3D domain-containing protein [Vicinamibacterales bacterium]